MMEIIIMALVGPFVAFGALMADPEPPMEEPQRSPAVNLCHPVVFDPETGGTRVDYSVNKCERPQEPTNGD
jgi:hypothetical protein